MAFRISFFNSPKPRVFNYRPRYFDPEKERWEQRRAQLNAEKKGETGTATQERLFQHNPGSHIRGSFQKALFENRRRTGDNKYVRVVVILSIVTLFVAAFYLADGLSFLFKSLIQQPVP